MDRKSVIGGVILKVLDRIDKVFLQLSMLWLFIIMVILAIVGLLRQFFDSPIVGAYFLVENYLMVAMIFPAMGYTWAKRGHISITFVYDKFPETMKKISQLIFIILGLFIMGLILYTGYDRTLSAFINGNVTSGLVRWPLWLAYIWVPIGAGLFCIRLIVEFVLNIASFFKKEA